MKPIVYRGVRRELPWFARNAEGLCCWHSTWAKAIQCAVNPTDECPVREK